MLTTGALSKGRIADEYGSLLKEVWSGNFT
jgi:hypothetical protein